MRPFDRSTKRALVRRIALVVAFAASGIVADPASAALLHGESAVKATRNAEIAPAVTLAPDGTSTWLAWAQNSPARPRTFGVFVETESGVRRVSAPGTHGLPGSFDGGTLVYAQAGRRGPADIRLYDVQSGRHVGVPRGVNTRHLEWWPSRSGRWLVFVRVMGLDEHVVLYDAETRRQSVLARARSDEFVFLGTRVSGSRAVWTRCLSRCDVFVRDLETGGSRMLPRPGPGLQQWGASVTADGTVYSLRSGRGCGANVTIVRHGAGDPSTGTILGSFPRGIDAFVTSPLVHADGSVDLYYDRLACRGSARDIYVRPEIGAHAP